VADATARTSGGRGRAWTKARSSPQWVAGVPTSNELLARLQSTVEETDDGAALVQAVRLCRDRGLQTPDWVIEALEDWLAEVTAIMAPPKLRPAIASNSAPGFVRWAKGYLPAFRDDLILSHVECDRDPYGLTWAEAYDEASCHFRGTKLAASPEAIKGACHRARARRRTGWLRRPQTHWEFCVLSQYFNPSKSLSDWWVVNSDRTGDARGQWRTRPRLLAHLQRSEYARLVKAAKERLVGKK
jgi:hypothetical protein